MAADPEKVRTQLAWLLANGSPAGKAYAATLLDELDPAAGRAAWGSLPPTSPSSPRFRAAS